MFANDMYKSLVLLQPTVATLGGGGRGGGAVVPFQLWGSNRTAVVDQGDESRRQQVELFSVGCARGGRCLWRTLGACDRRGRAGGSPGGSTASRADRRAASDTPGGGKEQTGRGEVTARGRGRGG